MAPERAAKKIFVMDDDPEMQIFLANLLHSGGYRAIIAESGKDGLQQILEADPVLVILCMLKYRDRKREIYRNLKNDAKLRRIPVILLSNIERRTFFHYQKFKSHPMGTFLPEPEGYFVKPLEADALLQSIHRLTRPAPSPTDEESPP